MKVLVTYNAFRESFAELESRYDVTFPSTAGNFTYDEVLQMIPEYDVLCPMFDFPVGQEMMDRGGKLQLIANYAVGYDNIDVAHALSKGIAVTNTPAPTTAPTANLALALLLDTARRVSESDRKLRQAGKNAQFSAFDNFGHHVTDATLGIIGMGRIGKALSKRARACGMDVVYHNRRRLDLNEETRVGAYYVDMDELLATSDFISLNAPYTPQTHHLIGEAEFARMKPTAILINTARGPLVDEKALVKALQEGSIAGAGLDVYEFDNRPLPELLTMENVVLTPHIGTQTAYTRAEMAHNVSNNIIGFFEGDRPVNRVPHP